MRSQLGIKSLVNKVVTPPARLGVANKSQLSGGAVRRSPRNVTPTLHPVNLFEVGNEGSNKPQPRRAGTPKAAPIAIPILSATARRSTKIITRAKAANTGDFTPGFDTNSAPAVDISNASSTVEMTGFDDQQQAVQLTPSKFPQLLKEAEQLKASMDREQEVNNNKPQSSEFSTFADFLNHDAGWDSDWNEIVDADLAEQNVKTPTKLGLLGGAPTGTPQQEEEEEEGEDADWTSFWDIHPKDPKEIAALKHMYQGLHEKELANHPEWTDEEKKEADNKLQRQFETHLENKCLNKEYQLPWYEKFWRPHVGQAGSKKHPPDLRYNVSLTYAGDEYEIIDGKPVDEYLEHVYLKFAENLKKRKPHPWTSFVTDQQDGVRKNTQRNKHRELTMKERHFFWILRQRKPNFPTNGTFDTTRWRTNLVEAWREPRNQQFQNFVTKQSFKVWDGETYEVTPPSSEKKKPEATVTSETPTKDLMDTDLEVQDPAAALGPSRETSSETETLVGAIADDERLTEHESDEDLDPHDQGFVDPEGSKMEESGEQEPAPLTSLTQDEEANVERWLTMNNVRCKRPLTTEAVLVDGKYPMPEQLVYKRFPTEKGGNVPQIWLKFPMPNQPGPGTQSKAAFAQTAWVAHDASSVLYNGVNKVAISKLDSDAVQTYLGLPRLPFLDIRTAHAEADLGEVELYDYWGEEWGVPQPHPRPVEPQMEQHDMHKNGQFYVPKIIWDTQQNRKSYTQVFLCPWGDRIPQDWRCDDENLLYHPGATLKDLLHGLTKFKFERWNPGTKPGRPTGPIYRNCVGICVDQGPLGPNFDREFEHAFERERLKWDQLPSDVQQNPLALEHKKDGTFIRDGFGRISVAWTHVASDNTKRHKTEALVSRSSRPYGTKDFRDVIHQWLLGTHHKSLHQWWNQRAALTQEGQNLTWGKRVKDWFERWSTTTNWPIPIPSMHPMNLTKDDFYCYMTKLDIWWNACVYPFFQKSKASHTWVTTLTENLSMFYHSHRAFYTTMSRRDDKTARQLSRQAKAVTIATGGQPPKAANVPSKQKFLPPRSELSKSLPSLRPPTAIEGKQSEIDREKAKLRDILNDRDLHQMYQCVELGKDPFFNIDISEAKISSANVSEGRANVVYYFKDGQTREKISTDEFSVLTSRITAGILDLSISGDLNIDEESFNIGDIRHVPDTGAMMIKCGSVKSAVWLGRNINKLVHPFTLRPWDTDRDTTYRFKFYLPSAACNFPTETIIKGIRASNRTTLDWLTVPKEGIRPENKWKTFVVNCGQEEATKIEEGGKVFKFAFYTGWVLPVNALAPACTIQEGAEKFRHALKNWEAYLQEGDANEFEKYKSTAQVVSIVDLIEETNKDDPDPAAARILKELREKDMKPVQQIPTHVILDQTAEDVKRLATQEKLRVQGRLRLKKPVDVNPFPADYVFLERSAVFNALREAKDPKATDAKKQAAATTFSKFQEQEVRRARIAAIEEHKGSSKQTPKPGKRAASASRAEAPSKKPKTNKPAYLQKGKGQGGGKSKSVTPPPDPSST